MLDLHGFTAPVDNYEGLYKISDDLKRNRQQKDVAAQQAKANQSAVTKWLQDYADPKEHLSGTPTDPQMIGRYGNMLVKGMQFIKDNPTADQNALKMVLVKDANELAKYAEVANVIKRKTEDSLKNIPANSGYDKFKLNKFATETAWYNPDGTVKKVEELNPDEDYVGKTIQNRPEDVVNNSGLDEWMKGQHMVENSNKLKVVNSKGGYEMKNVITNAYPWAIPDIDEKGNSTGKLVPEYEVAHDGQNPILHDFKDASGKTITAPVRMITDERFKSILGNRPDVADWLRGEINKSIKSGEYKDAYGKPIDINSPQAEMLGKAILYDEIKSRGLGGIKEVVEQKANPAPRVSITVNNSKEPPPINNLYQRIDDKVEEGIAKDGKISATFMNSLEGDALEYVLDLANNARKPGYYDEKGNWKADAPLDSHNTFLHKDNGQIWIYKTDDDGTKSTRLSNRIVAIPKIATDVKAQPTAKGKNAVLKNQHKSYVPSFTKQQLLKAGWKQSQIEEATKAAKIQLIN